MHKQQIADTYDVTIIPLVMICYTSALKKMKPLVNMKSMINNIINHWVKYLSICIH